MEDVMTPQFVHQQCLLQPRRGLLTIHVSMIQKNKDYSRTFAAVPGNCCPYNDVCIPIFTREAREEKCEWVECSSSALGPVLQVYSQFDSINCCMGEDEVMYEDGEEIISSKGTSLTCCNGKWMKPAM